MNQGFSWPSSQPPNVFQQNRQSQPFQNNRPNGVAYHQNYYAQPHTYNAPQGAFNAQPAYNAPSTAFSAPPAAFSAPPAAFSAPPTAFGATQAAFNTSSAPQSNVLFSSSQFKAPLASSPFNSSQPGAPQLASSQKKVTSAFSTVPSGSAQQQQQQQSLKKERRREQPTFGSHNDDKSNKRDKKKNYKEKPRKTRQQNQSMPPPTFPGAQFTHRPDPAANSNDTVLKPLPKPLTTFSSERNAWDVRNQDRLLAIEKQYLAGKQSLQTSYEQMSRMRDDERREMEKLGLVDSTETRKNLTDAIQFVGSCLEMCPVFERVRRVHENNTLSLERDAQGKVASNLAVKAFSRPAAGQPPPLPSDVRPPNVLVSTLQYLVSNILPKLPSSHPFLWDRTRSIRQDFTYQNYQGQEALWCFEVIARIHCVALHKMAKASFEGVEWSQQQELEQFNKCLQSLSEFYQNQPFASANEAEIRAYELLSHFFDDETAAKIDRLPVEISRHPLVALALELRSIATASVTKFFERVRQPDVPPTFRAIAEIHFNALRMRAVRQLLESMHKRMNMYSLARFNALLGFETEEQSRAFCDHYDILISYSPEAGPEVDIKTWDEQNVKDKQAMGQAFDLSLDGAIEELNVLESLATTKKWPVARNPSGQSNAAFQPSATVQEFQKTPSVQPRMPSFQLNPAAPAFQPKQAMQQTAQPKRESLSASPFSQPPQPSQPQRLQPQPEFSQIPPSQPQDSQTSFIEAERAREQERKLAEQCEAEKKRQQLAAELAQKQQEENQRQQQRQLQAERQKREQQQRQQEQARERQERRRQFIKDLQTRILSNLSKTVCEHDCDQIATSVLLANKLLVKQIVKRVREATLWSIERSQERKQREHELQSFRNTKTRKRVVSTRSGFNVLANDSINDRDAKNSPSSSREPDSAVLDTTPLRNNRVRPAPQVFDFTPLLPLLRKVHSCGLRQLRFVADWRSESGIWLREMLQLESFLAIAQGMQFKLAMHTVPGEFDVVITDPTGNTDTQSQTAVAVHTDAAILKSSNQLKLDIEAALHKFLAWYESTLTKHRSLSIKRRRLTHDRNISTADMSAVGTGNTSEGNASLTSKKSVSVGTERLRALIAETDKLMNA